MLAIIHHHSFIHSTGYVFGLVCGLARAGLPFYCFTIGKSNPSTPLRFLQTYLLSDLPTYDVNDYAFLKTDSGQMICGFGPFSEASLPPESGVAFYVNDFELSDPAPWKIPQETVRTPDLEPIRSRLNGSEQPEIVWKLPDDAKFQPVYEDIMRDIDSGKLQKSVPVMTERGKLMSGTPEALMASVDDLPAAFFSYGFRCGQSGFVGATPELLFALHGQQLTTMALAGTAAAENAATFEKDAKEIQEHEFVAEYLVQRLSGLGEVSREPRQLLNLGAIAHFLSPIHVDLAEQPELDALIRMMHPTPALGSFPRSEAALSKLRTYREQLEAPANFGAPFGVKVDGVFHAVVGIRNVSWQDFDVYLPSGVGVVRESVFEREWHELSLKRQAVKTLLGL